jgi:regulator of nucleoside diphosphate kinase
MTRTASDRRKPKITVSQDDHRLISEIATAAFDRLPEVAEELLAEMDRAKVVAARLLPPGVIRLGSTLEFRSDDGHQRRVTLVMPAEADIAQGKVSIMTPIGAALIGLSEGQSMMWTTRDGHRHELTVLSVEPAEAAVA